MAFAGTRALLADLRPRFRIGIVSNFYGNLERVIDEAKLGKLVDAVIDSARVGTFKPAPGIFKAALRALRVDARDSAVVGDSLDKDCAPAQTLGLRTVWFNPNGARRSGNAPDFTIADLAELKTLEWGDGD